MKFSIKDFFSKFPVDLVTFTKEILNRKLHFLRSEKQPSIGALKSRCSENMQQIYRRTPMPKCTHALMLLVSQANAF